MIDTKTGLTGLVQLVYFPLSVVSIVNLVCRVFEVKRKEMVGVSCYGYRVTMAMENSLNKSILSPIKLKFNMVRGIPQLNEYAKFQLIST